MKRMIKPSRIGKLLEPHGFALANDVGDSLIVYSRPAEVPELWEQILINVGGRRGEAVLASVRANVRYAGRSGHGLLEAMGVPETGSPGGPPPLPPPGARLLRDHEDALLWEGLVARICPDRARALAREVGSELLSRTVEARAAVAKYLELFGTLDWRELRAKIDPRATAAERREAQRIAMTPPTIEIFNGRELYTTIVLALILYSERVEGRQLAPPGAVPWPPHNPHSKARPDWSKYALAWRIDLLVDRILAQYPNPMPSRMPDE